MILQVSVGHDIEVTFDDEISSQRPTPEVVADYLSRLCKQAVDAWMALPNQQG